MAFPDRQSAIQPGRRTINWYEPQDSASAAGWRIVPPPPVGGLRLFRRLADCASSAGWRIVPLPPVGGLCLR